MTGKTRGILAVVAIVALGLFVLMGLGVFGGPSDKEKIQTALKEAIEASKEGRPGGVIDLLSRELEINGQKYPTGQISKVIREKKPDVDVVNQDPNITGEGATIKSPVKLNILMFERTIPDVTLHFEKEDTKRWLIFPARDWKLTRVELSEATLGEIQNTFGGY